MARNWYGSSIIELAAIIWIVPVFALLCVNVGILVFGAWTCDAACRDAARAAGQQTGPDWQTAQANAQNAARAALLPLANVGYPFTPPTVVGQLQYKTYGLDSSNNVIYYSVPDASGPYVQVTVNMQASMPCPIIWSSARFTDKVSFTQSYAYPIISAPAQAGGP